MQRPLSLPKRDSGGEDSGSQCSDCTFDDDPHRTAYMLRLTPDDNTYSYESLKKWLDAEWEFYIVCTENSKKDKLHYHVFLETDISQDDVKATVRGFLHSYYPPEKRKRGWGNKQYNLQVVQDYFKGASYVLKDGNFEYKGYSDDFVQMRFDESYEKPKGIKLELKELNEQFQNDDMMSIGDYMVSFNDIKAKYNQPVNMTLAYNYALSALIRREPSQSRILATEFLSRHT